MLIRQYTSADLDALRALHAAQGFDYAFPDVADPLFVSKLVLEDGTCSAGLQPSISSDLNAALKGGATESAKNSACATVPRIRAAALLRLTCEAYLLLDPRDAAPRERWARIVALQEAASRDAWAKGLADVHCWLPPRIARRFGRRLESLGWVRDDSWTPYCKKLTP
jgi:hypothetical protein